MQCYFNPHKHKGCSQVSIKDEIRLLSNDHDGQDVPNSETNQAEVKQRYTRSANIFCIYLIRATNGREGYHCMLSLYNIMGIEMMLNSRHFM